MEKLVISVFALGLAALAALHLRRLSRWTICTATSQLPADQHHAYTGQKLPISYRTPDGNRITSTLTVMDGRSGPRKAGTTMLVMYDPQCPTDVVAITTPLLLAAAVAVTLFVAAVPWFQ